MRYSTSWSDQFVDWLKKIPSPYWLTCFILGILLFIIDLCLFIIAELSNNLDTSATPSTITVILGTIGFVPAYTIYILGALPPQISFHLQKLRPILKISNEEYETIHDKMALRNLPGGLLWLGHRFVLIISMVILVSIWLTTAGSGIWTFLFITALVLSLLLLIFMSVLVLFKVGNVLKQVIRLQYQPLEMNILNPSPLFAVSRLTQRLALYVLPVATAIGFLAISLGLSTWNVYSPIGKLPSLAEISILVLLALLGPILLLISIFIFTYPVLWIRRLILEKKEELLVNIATQLQAAFSEYTRRVTKGKWANVSELTSSVEFLTAQEERYQKIPEWPWEGHIFREFVGALVIPVLLWIMQFYLEKYISILAN